MGESDDEAAYSVLTQQKWLEWAAKYHDGDFKSIVDARLAVPPSELAEQLEKGTIF